MRHRVFPIPAILCWLLIGCGSGYHSPELSVTPTTLTFSNLTVGQTSPAQSVTLKNVGTGELIISTITLSDTANYRLTQDNPCTSLATGASCALSVMFSPQTAGTLTATIDIRSNSSGVSSSSFLIHLTGGGIASSQPPPPPPPPPQPPPGTQLRFFPSSLSYGTGAGSYIPTTVRTVTVTNVGTSAVAFDSINISGANSDAFGEANDCPTTLSAGASCNLYPIFVPTANGVTVSGGVDFTYQVAGSTAVLQTFSMTGKANAYFEQVSFDLLSLDFPATTVNASAAPRTVEFTGGTPLTNASYAITGPNASAFSITANSCSSTVLSSEPCWISVTFAPKSAGSFTASLSVTDDAPTSPQSIALTGTGTAAPAAAVTLSTPSPRVPFPDIAVGVSATPYPIKITNTGNAPLLISGFSFTGITPSEFSETDDCTTAISPNNSCNLLVMFNPATSAGSDATLSIADNASDSPQTLDAYGNGTSYPVNQNVYPLPYADFGMQSLSALISSAKTSIDMTQYLLADTAFINALTGACQRGVTVRVILDQNSQKIDNTAAYNSLNAQAHCSAVWANTAFAATDQRSFVIDGKQLAVMTLDFQSQGYSLTHDFAIVTNDSTDIVGVQTTFNADFAAGTPPSGTPGASDTAFNPPSGTHLVWAPASSQATLLSIIQNAKLDLLIDDQDMSSSAIVSALQAACGRHVITHITTPDIPANEANFAVLKAAGCKVRTYPANSILHTNAIVADYGIPSQAIYVGSSAFSDSSLNQNRGLGIRITDEYQSFYVIDYLNLDHLSANPF